MDMLVKMQELITDLIYMGPMMKFLIALLMMAFFWYTRGIFSRVILAPIKKLVQKTKNDIDDHLINALERPLKVLYIFMAFYLIGKYLPLTEGQDVLLRHILRSGLVIAVTMALYYLTEQYFLSCRGRKKCWGLEIDEILIPFFANACKFIVVALSISVIAQEWGYDFNGFIAGLGLGGLALALAAQNTLSNVFGGIVIILEKPFSIGDWIMTPSVEGVVEDINFRSTRVRTFAQALVTVPNATLSDESITNWSRMGKRRITFKLGVTYSTSREQMLKCLQDLRQMLKQHKEVDPETIFVNFDEFNDNSLDIFLYFFTITTKWEEYLNVKEDVNLKIMAILEANGVSAAFPSRSIYLENATEFNNAKEKASF